MKNNYKYTYQFRTKIELGIDQQERLSEVYNFGIVENKSYSNLLKNPVMEKKLNNEKEWSYSVNKRSRLTIKELNKLEKDNGLVESSFEKTVMDNSKKKRFFKI